MIGWENANRSNQFVKQMSFETIETSFLRIFQNLWYIKYTFLDLQVQK